MFTVTKYSGESEEQYALVTKQLKALIEDEPNRIANLANASALLNQFLKTINWVGFYLMDEGKEELVLGPFNGLPACVRIPFGKGVCGSAAQKRETLRVKDVREFPGHIACDSASLSEIVIPMIKEDKVIGVLDIDSPITNRFSDVDQRGLETFVQTLIPHI
ncbi:GAF domain-containing protein [Pullulanibacillus pueri]|uniref:GAF domain-containing protein n=1 Tax=Pullulanibacillus pueri TaxID=1437324 RepID=A0A8J3EP03_9BACL|nr:GAF domain-containing protein [Pullulanibacillus pueri]MBM7683965.1 GAF domain-containing protein [Pullulanibacillus pueri]GGH88100.1 hypothetical protein GCM10007096_39660 [Pullulanibacillus pueri]